jgi:hypothetical protein
MARPKIITLPPETFDRLMEMEAEYWMNHRRPIVRRVHFVSKDGRTCRTVSKEVWNALFGRRRRSEFGRTARLF